MCLVMGIVALSITVSAGGFGWYPQGSRCHFLISAYIAIPLIVLLGGDPQTGAQPRKGCSSAVSAGWLLKRTALRKVRIFSFYSELVMSASLTDTVMTLHKTIGIAFTVNQLQYDIIL